MQITLFCSLSDKRKDFQTVKLAGGILTADGIAVSGVLHGSIFMGLLENWIRTLNGPLYNGKRAHIWGKESAVHPCHRKPVQEWMGPAQHEEQSKVVYHMRLPPRPVRRVSLLKLMAKDWFEDDFILRSVWFSGGREWIGQTDVLLKATPSSLAQETEGRRMPQASVLTWNALRLPPRPRARTTSQVLHPVAKAGRRRGSWFLVPASISQNI